MAAAATLKGPTIERSIFMDLELRNAVEAELAPLNGEPLKRANAAILRERAYIDAHPMSFGDQVARYKAAIQKAAGSKASPDTGES